jgi:shikimate kinase
MLLGGLAMNNLVLTGFAGTGKTTVGRFLARKLDLSFVDMDWLIEERQGRSIRELFATEGETFFRQLETDLCKELAKWRGYVVSTGGGTLVNPNNLAIVSPGNLVVCLDAHPDDLWQRLAQKSDRPLLNAADIADKKQQLLDLLYERTEAYARIEQHIQTTNCDIQDIVNKVAALWNHVNEERL